MTRILKGLNSVLNGVSANGAGAAMNIENYEDVMVQLYTTGSTTAVIKFAVSLSLTQPDFTSSPSATNVYDYADITPINNQATPIVGGTGIVLTGTDVVKLYQIDVKYVKWICPIVSGRSAGVIHCDLAAANNYSR